MSWKGACFFYFQSLGVQSMWSKKIKKWERMTTRGSPFTEKKMALTNWIWCWVDMMLCAEVRCGKWKSWAPEKRKRKCHRVKCIMPATEGAVALNLQSRCCRRRWAPVAGGRSGETGSRRSQSRKAFPGLALLPTKHANIHSSEMLKVVTGGQIHDNPPLPHPP